MTLDSLSERFVPLAALLCAIVVFVAAVLDPPADVDAEPAPSIVSH